METQLESTGVKDQGTDSRTGAFLNGALGDAASVLTVPASALGDRLGRYGDRAACGPQTVAELAAAGFRAVRRFPIENPFNNLFLLEE